jgi:hypothetical protein
MANVVVKLKRENKRFNYSTLKEPIVLWNLKLKDDVITGKIKHYPSEKITDLKFGVVDYYGIDTVQDWSSPSLSKPEMEGFSYIREVMENLLENKLVNK